ncbi:MAG: ribokinase [Bacteroidota bacterium]
MSKKPTITVVGSYMTDLMSRTPWLPAPGETTMGGPFKMGPGGKGANQAVAAARLGGHVTMLVSLGTDFFGEVALNNLVKEKIDTRFVKRDSDAHTGVALIIVDDVKGENMIVVAPGSNQKLGPDDVRAARDTILASDYIVMQLEIPLETVAYTTELAAEKGIPVILNPAPGRQLPMDLLARVRILTPNETEAQLVTGLPVTDLKSAEAAGRWLVDRGVGVAVLTLGAKGAMIVTADGAEHVPGFEVEVVDTTGAGDAFNGGLAVGLGEGKSLREAVRFANAAAALSVTKVGTAPAMPYLEEVEEFLARRR